MDRIKMLVDGKPVYKITMFIKQRVKTHKKSVYQGADRFEDVLRRSEVVIGNREIADHLFTEYTHEVKRYCTYTGHFGAACLWEAEYCRRTGQLWAYPTEGRPEDYAAIYQVTSNGDIISYRDGINLNAGVEADGTS